VPPPSFVAPITEGSVFVQEGAAHPPRNLFLPSFLREKRDFIPHTMSLSDFADAVIENDVVRVKSFLAAGQDVDGIVAEDMDVNFTGLLVASLQGWVLMVRAFIAAGATIDLADATHDAAS